MLAGLWEFPSLLLDGDCSEVKHRKVLCAELSRILGSHLAESPIQYVGEVINSIMHRTTHKSALSV